MIVQFHTGYNVKLGMVKQFINATVNVAQLKKDLKFAYGSGRRKCYSL